MKSCVWLTVAVLLTFLMVERAHAASSVAVLGVRSLDGEGELEQRLSLALHTSAKKIATFAVSERVLSLEQMMLAHGCDEPNAACLNDVAKTLTVDTLLYGTVVSAPGGHELALFAYKTSSSNIESSILRELSEERLGADRAGETVSKLLHRMLHPTSTGKLEITGSPAGSEILIDGISRGTLAADGTLAVELAPGKHRVRAASPGYHATKDYVAIIEAGAITSVELKLEKLPVTAPPPVTLPELEPEKTSRQSLRRTLGWVSVGVGSAFAIATIYTWVRIGKLNDSRDFQEYRAAFPRAGTKGGVSDVCKAAEAGSLVEKDPSRSRLEADARDHCSEADKLEVLQYVFAGGALAGGGLGTYLLLTSRNRPPATLSFHPRVGTSTALLEASLRF